MAGFAGGLCSSDTRFDTDHESINYRPMNACPSYQLISHQLLLVDVHLCRQRPCASPQIPAVPRSVLGLGTTHRAKPRVRAGVRRLKKVSEASGLDFAVIFGCRIRARRWSPRASGEGSKGGGH